MRLSEYLKDRRVVLASGSPRRKELLAQIGIFPEVLPSNAEENTRETRPECLVMELAERKALDVAAGCGKDTLVIGADTVVSIDGEILGKPGTPERAVRMIEKLSGRSHQVYTGVALILCREDGRRETCVFAEKTEVHVYPMDEDEIREYAYSKEPLDKAGGYGIQGRFAAYIQGIEGDYGNVVGLPLGRLSLALKQLLGKEFER